jgi:hypothetical protein
MALLLIDLRGENGDSRVVIELKTVLQSYTVRVNTATGFSIWFSQIMTLGLNVTPNQNLAELLII